MEAQNPYHSIFVEASAGSGKTYQLSRRFLCLVAAHSHPRDILTVTFTVKAVSEMKSRIIAESSKLLSDPHMQKEFDDQMKDFHRHSGSDYPKPLSAQDTAKKILSHTQSLKICTIDALFQEWFQKFPWEALYDEKGRCLGSYPYQIMDQDKRIEIEDAAWNEFFRFSKETLGAEFVSGLIDSCHKGAISLQGELKELDKQEDYLWQIQDEFFEHETQFLPLSFRSEESFFQVIREDLLDIISNLNQKDVFLESMGTFSEFKQTKLLTQDGRISGLYLKGKKREALEEPVSRVETWIQKWFAFEKLSLLNKRGLLFLKSYSHLWKVIVEKEKKKQSLLGFSDVARGCFRIFQNHHNKGAFWLIRKQVQHLLIDEFQDTSLLQWGIFEPLIQEILSSEKKTPSTVFIVGDRKQSIYGFRQADPYVMDLCREIFRVYQGKEVYMNESFRSSQTVLDEVNRVFTQIPGFSFIPHLSSPLANIPSNGTVSRFEEFENLEDEAHHMAQFLKDVLDQKSQEYLIYDKKTASNRPIKAKDICLLYRNSTHVEIFEKALSEKNVPFLREEQKGFFAQREIIDLLSLLQFLAFPQDHISLLAFLNSPYGLHSHQDIISLLKSQKNIWDELKMQHVDLWNQLVSLKDLSKMVKPSWLFYDVFRLFPVPEESTQDQNRLIFLELLISLEKEGFLTLPSILRELHRLKKSDNIQGALSQKEESITLMTIHKSKGLEFGMVCLVESQSKWYKPDPYWLKILHNKSIAYIGRKEEQPQGFGPFEKTLSETRKEQIEETQRLLYVALTRASHHLVISGHVNKKF